MLKIMIGITCQLYRISYLIHGQKIIQDSVLPIAQILENAPEVCNIFYSINRRRFPKKNYRQKTMKDVFKRFSSYKEFPAKQLKSLSADTMVIVVSICGLERRAK